MTLALSPALAFCPFCGKPKSRPRRRRSLWEMLFHPMAAGDQLLDSSGARILDASGNRMKSDGAGDACCCGGVTNYQARKCSDNTLAPLYLTQSQFPAFPSTYYFYLSGVCYYVQSTDTTSNAANVSGETVMPDCTTCANLTGTACRECSSNSTGVASWTLTFSGVAQDAGQKNYIYFRTCDRTYWMTSLNVDTSAGTPSGTWKLPYIADCSGNCVYGIIKTAGGSAGTDYRGTSSSGLSCAAAPDASSSKTFYAGLTYNRASGVVVVSMGTWIAFTDADSNMAVPGVPGSCTQPTPLTRHDYVSWFSTHWTQSNCGGSHTSSNINTAVGWCQGLAFSFGGCATSAGSGDTLPIACIINTGGGFSPCTGVGGDQCYIAGAGGSVTATPNY